MGNTCLAVEDCPRDSEELEAENIFDAINKLELTVVERQTVVATWQKLNCDYQSKGIRVFDQMMESPEIKALFQFKHQPVECLHQIPLYREHSSRIIECVSAVVEELEYGEVGHHNATLRGPVKIGLLLYSLGQAHSRIHNLKPEFFLKVSHEFFITALMSVWREDLGSDWCPATELAWFKLFCFMVAQLYRGLVFEAASLAEKNKAAEKKPLETSHRAGGSLNWLSALGAAVVGRRRLGKKKVQAVFEW